MENLYLVRFILRRGDWMVKVDLWDACLTVYITENHQKFVRFASKRNYFEYRCLPFGISSAPRLNTKILRPVLGFLREKGIRWLVYLDDFLMMAEERASVLEHLKVVVPFLQDLCFLINEDKSVFMTSQMMEFLGVNIDSLAMSFSLPKSKVDKVFSMCSPALTRDKI